MDACASCSQPLPKRCNHAWHSCCSHVLSGGLPEVKHTVVPNAHPISDADLARIEQLKKVPIESVADEASMVIMAETVLYCVNGLSISESEEESYYILGAAFQLVFMLGRQSAIN